MNFYNTLTRKVEEFIPNNKDEIKMYTCGPTVYHYAHIGNLRTYINLFIVWFLTGFWHGASWNFIIWGIYYGIILILEKFVFASVIKKLPVFVTRIYTMLAVNIGWGIFEIYSPADELGFVGAMFGAGGSLFDSFTLNIVHNYSIILVIAAITATGLPLRLWKKICNGRKLDGTCIVGQEAATVA